MGLKGVFFSMIACGYVFAQAPNLNALYFLNDVRWSKVKITQARKGLERALLDEAQANRDYPRIRRLFERNAESEDGYRLVKLTRDTAALHVEQMKRVVTGLEMDKKLNELHYDFAMGKQESLADVVRVQLGQWENQLAIAKIRKRIAARQLDYQEWKANQYTELVKKGAAPLATWEQAQTELAKTQAEQREIKTLINSLEGVVEDLQSELAHLEPVPDPRS